MFYQNAKQKLEDLQHAHPCLWSHTNLVYSVLHRLHSFFLPGKCFSFHRPWGMAVGLVPAARRSPILLRHPPVCTGACFSLVPWHCWDTRTLSKLSRGSCSQGKTNLPLSRSTQAREQQPEQKPSFLQDLMKKPWNSSALSQLVNFLSLHRST